LEGPSHLPSVVGLRKPRRPHAGDIALVALPPFEGLALHEAAKMGVLLSTRRRFFRNAAVCALRNAAVCELRKAAVCALRSAAVCALRNTAVCALRNAAVCALGNAAECALRNAAESTLGNATECALCFFNEKSPGLVGADNAAQRTA
jgi:hypothetical protein